MDMKTEKEIIKCYASLMRTVCVYYTEGDFQNKDKAVACFETASHFMKACFPKTYKGTEYDNNILNDALKAYGVDRAEFIEFMLRNRW